MNKSINFTGHSTSLLIRVFKAVGYAEFIAEADAETLLDEKKQDGQKNKLIKLIFERRGYAERELNAFFTDVTGVNDIEKLGYKEYSEIENAVYGHEDFKDFFMSAQQSVAAMFGALR